MLVATYAKQIGRAVAFSLAAFRQAFAAGRDLGDPDTVMLAAAACEMHPAAIEKGAGRDSIRRRLDEATAAARRAACSRCPPSGVGDRVFHGDRELEARRGGAAHEGQPRVRAARAQERPRAGRCWPRRRRRPHRGGGDRHRRGRAVLGHAARARPAGSRAALRADLAALDADAFIAKWRRWQTA